MAFRSQTAACLIFAGVLPAQQLEFPVRMHRLPRPAPAMLIFTGDGIRLQGKDSQAWKYDDIQRLELSPSRLEILTYQDARWQLGRDRRYLFDRLPEHMAAQLYPLLSSKLDQRFVAALADPHVEALWLSPAKMLHGRSGANGTLKIGADRIVFESPSQSRTWRYRDIRNITTEGPLEFTISSADRDTRFQLKQVLPEDRYNDLWRRIWEANGLQTFHSSLENHHHD